MILTWKLGEFLEKNRTPEPSNWQSKSNDDNWFVTSSNIISDTLFVSVLHDYFGITARAA